MAQKMVPNFYSKNASYAKNQLLNRQPGKGLKLIQGQKKPEIESISNKDAKVAEIKNNLFFKAFSSHGEKKNPAGKGAVAQFEKFGGN